VMGFIVQLALSTLHNFSALALSKDYEVLGIVLGMFTRVAFSVSAGETRYGRSRSGAVQFNDYWERFPMEARTGAAGREPCYQFMLRRDSESIISDSKIMYYIFKNLSWGGSYGGARWASCTKSTINLFNACINRKISRVVELFNIVINENHNGGKYLNKVIDVKEFNRAAKDASYYAIKRLPSIVDILHTAWEFGDFITEEQWKEYREVFKEIKLDGNIPEAKAKPKKKIKAKKKASKVYFLDHANSEDGKITNAKILNDQGLYADVSLTKPLDDPNFAVNENCSCKDCTSQWTKLYSEPRWWTLKDGTKMISKVKLNNLVKSQGITPYAGYG